MPESDLLETITRVERILCELRIRHHYTGGIASSYHGEPRTTQDVDVVVLVEEDDIARLVEALQSHFFADMEDIRESTRVHRMFQVLDKETFFKVDFHVGADVPGELERTRWEPIFGTELFPIVAKEDAILSKLLWAKKGSGKSRDDVIGMLLEPTQVDTELVESLAKELSVLTLFQELGREARLRI